MCFPEMIQQPISTPDVKFLQHGQISRMVTKCVHVSLTLNFRKWPWFEPVSVKIRFLVDKVALRRGFPPPKLQLFLTVSFHQFSAFIFLSSNTYATQSCQLTATLNKRFQRSYRYATLKSRYRLQVSFLFV